MSTNTSNVFQCKEFEVVQEDNKMKVNTDAMLLGAWSIVMDKSRVLDIGTGTGIIALMLSQRNSRAQVVGVEIDRDSALEAKLNFNNSKWNRNLTIVNQSIQDYSRESNEKYDLIVSNPPFFSGGTLSLNENKNNVKHTTKLSHGDLLIAVSRLIRKDGYFDIILPYLEGERFIELSQRYNLFPERITEVRSRQDSPIERLMVSFSNKKVDVNRETLILFTEGKERTPTLEYSSLLSSFYLKF